MSDTYQAAKAHKAQLLNDQIRLTEKLQTIGDQSTNSRAEKDRSDAALERCEKNYILDKASFDDLEAARESSKKAAEKYASTERLRGLVVEELERLDRDLLKAQEKIISTCSRFATAEREALSTSINKDAKFRSRLLEIYAAQQVSSNFSTPSWHLFLGSIFSQPTEAEAKEAALKFKQKYSLD